MALILGIDTSTTVCSIAWVKEGKILFESTLSQEKSHAENITLLIQHSSEILGISLSDLDAIAVCKGPGSYTGLRIGVATAKGLCLALDKPMIAIDAMKAMAHLFFELHPVKSEYWVAPMIDARRMEVYTALLDRQLLFQKEIHAMVIDKNSFEEFKNQKIAVVGNSNFKVKEVLNTENIEYFPSIFPHAKSVAQLAEGKFQDSDFENLVYFEPFYLKDFMATTPKSKS